VFAKSLTLFSAQGAANGKSLLKIVLSAFFAGEEKLDGFLHYR